METKGNNEQELGRKAQNIKLLVMDCDGVLTDGSLYFSETGESLKVFNVRDGQGITLWHSAGFQTAIISGRTSKALTARIKELRIKHSFLESKDKVKDLAALAAETGLSYSEMAFIGDDLPDIPVLELVGLPIAVADAECEVLSAAAYITKRSGGHGAVRDAIDFLLLHHGRIRAK